MKGALTIIMLILSNTFMTLARYGHSKFSGLKWFSKLELISIILLRLGYCSKDSSALRLASYTFRRYGRIYK